MYPHRTKLSGVKSGERAAQEIETALTILLPSDFSFNCIRTSLEEWGRHAILLQNHLIINMNTLSYKILRSGLLEPRRMIQS